jgi:hypothetical protein
MRMLVRSLSLVALAASLGAQTATTASPPALPSCDSASVLLTATPIKGVGVKTIAQACPAFARAITTWFVANPGVATWPASQVVAALVSSPKPIPPAPVPTPQPVTPPSPTPTPLPVPPPAPQPSLALLWSDDFTRYTSTADLLARFAQSVPGMEISSGPTGNVQLETIDGIPRMALHWPGGGAGPTPTFSPRFNPPPVFTRLSVKWRDRYSAGFQLLAEYKAFLVQLGPNTNSGMPQIGVYLEAGGRVKMDITDRVHNINTGSPQPGIPGNSPIQTFQLPAGWQGGDHDWEIVATMNGAAPSTFSLLYDGAVIIGPLTGLFCPTAPQIGGPGQIFIVQPGANYNAPLPAAAQSRWFSLIGVRTGA